MSNNSSNIQDSIDNIEHEEDDSIVSTSISIRSSRRKTKKGSAVVLNTRRIQKVIEQDPQSVNISSIGNQRYSNGETEEKNQSSSSLENITEEDHLDREQQINYSEFMNSSRQTEQPESIHAASDKVSIGGALPGTDGANSWTSPSQESEIAGESTHFIVDQLTPPHTRSDDDKVSPSKISPSQLPNAILESPVDSAPASRSVSAVNSSKISMPESNSYMIVLRVEDCALTIQRWWRKTILLRNERHSQFGRWTSSQSELVLATLLGHRVRWLFRSEFVEKNIKSQQDVWKVLEDLVKHIPNSTDPTQFQSKHLRQLPSPREILLRQLIDPSNTAADLMLNFPNLSMSDITLGRSLAKQISTERYKLQSHLWHDSYWQRFPAPGHWSLCNVIRKTLQGKNRKKLLSPQRGKPLVPKKTISETPSHIRGSSPVYHSEDRTLMTPPHTENASHAPEHNKRNIPASLKDLLSIESSSNAVSAANTSFGERAITGSGASVFKSPDVSNIRKINTSRSAPTSTNSTPMAKVSGKQQNKGTGASALPLSERCRASSKAHIQLDILSGEKLMPARKGANVREPDRIPCLKVKFLLPPWPGVGESSNSAVVDKMKKIYQDTRDFEQMTFNPVWDAKFVLNLPCSRSILQTIISDQTKLQQKANQEIKSGSRRKPRSIEFFANEIGDNSEAAPSSLTDEGYNYICKQLLQWWAQGIVEIEVFDGERFNTDIYMGHVQLLLSGFMVLIRPPDELEMKGSFQLEKHKPTDRVSGSIKLHAYLHVPEKEYIIQLLRSSITASSGSSKKTSSSKWSSRNRSMDGIVITDTSYTSAAELQTGLSRDCGDNESQPSLSVVYSSKFMKALSAQQPSRSNIYRSRSRNDESHHVDRGISFKSVTDTEDEMLSDCYVSCDDEPPYNSNSHNNYSIENSADSDGNCDGPHLDETENIKFNTRKLTGIAVGDTNIETSVNSSEHCRDDKPSSIHTPVKSENSGSATSSAENGDPNKRVISSSPSRSKLHYEKKRIQRSEQRVSSKITSSDGSNINSRERDNRAKPDFGNKDTSSIDSSLMRRNLVVDITKQLDVLSAVQDSTDQMLGNFHKQLEEKKRHREQKLQQCQHHKVQESSSLRTNNGNCIDHERIISDDYYSRNNDERNHSDYGSEIKTSGVLDEVSSSVLVENNECNYNSDEDAFSGSDRDVEKVEHSPSLNDEHYSSEEAEIYSDDSSFCGASESPGAIDAKRISDGSSNSVSVENNNKNNKEYYNNYKVENPIMANSYSTDNPVLANHQKPKATPANYYKHRQYSQEEIHPDVEASIERQDESSLYSSNIMDASFGINSTINATPPRVDDPYDSADSSFDSFADAAYRPQSNYPASEDEVSNSGVDDELLVVTKTDGNVSSVIEPSAEVETPERNSSRYRSHNRAKSGISTLQNLSPDNSPANHSTIAGTAAPTNSANGKVTLSGKKRENQMNNIRGNLQRVTLELGDLEL